MTGATERMISDEYFANNTCISNTARVCLFDRRLRRIRMAGFIESLSRKKYIEPSTISETELCRCLTKFDLTAFGLGATLGVGIYVLAGSIAKNLAGPAIVLSFLIAALASLLAALCYAEFASRVPKVGSAYVFSYVAVGELVAFVIGWNLILEYIIGMSSVARALSGYVDTLAAGKITNFTLSHIGESNFRKVFAPSPDFIAFALCLLVTLPMSIGVKLTSWTNNVITTINVLVVLIATCAGFSLAEGENWTNDFLPFGFSGVLAGAASAFYGFVGFDTIVTTAEEAKEPSKSIPMALMLTLGICFLAYFGVSASLTLMWPYYKLAERGALPKAFAMRGAAWAEYVIAVGALCGLTASLLGSLFPLPRLLYAMASDGLLFKVLARVNPKTEIPVIATVVSGLLAAFLALIFELEALVEMMSIGTLLAYAIVALCVLLLRYQPGSIGIKKSPPPSDDEGEQNSREQQRLLQNTGGRGPDEKTARLAAGAIYSLVVIFFCINTLLLYGIDALLEHEAWAVFLMCILSVLLLTGIVVLVRQPQNHTPLPFKVPFVPAIPLASLFVNIVLILKLSPMTWARFTVWMVIGKKRTSYSSVVEKV